MVSLENIDLRLGDYREVPNNMGGVDLMFTSPPYNIGSKAAKRDGFRKVGLYDPKSFGAVRDYDDDLPELEYQKQQAAFLVWCADHLKPGGTVVYNHKPRRRNGVMIHPAEWFLRPSVRSVLTLAEEVIWDRGSTHNHCKQMMWPITERLYVFYRADSYYRLDDNWKKGPSGGKSDLWPIPDLWPIHKLGNNAAHCAPFPLDLATQVLEIWSRPGDLVCDPYSGSGTTAVAARDLYRKFVGAEILEKYWTGAQERLRNGEPPSKPRVQPAEQNDGKESVTIENDDRDTDHMLL